MRTCSNAILWAAILIAGCTTTAPVQRNVESFDVELNVVDDKEKSVRSAEIFVNYESVGKTESTGLLKMDSILLPVGSKLKVDSRCPEGYFNEGSQLTLFARRQASTPKKQNQKLSGTVVCTSTHRLAVLSVKVSNLIGKEKKEPWLQLPVLINNRKLDATNSEGTALVAMKVRSNTEFDVTLDTSAFPTLEPQNPSVKFRVKDEDVSLGFEQEFEMPVAIKTPTKKKKKKKKKRRPRKPKGPTKIE